MSGELDSNVPARQAMEMYYALRRLGKEVEWVQYMDGGHGMPTVSVEEVKDYHQRIVAWYDTHLNTMCRDGGASRGRTALVQGSRLE